MVGREIGDDGLPVDREAVRSSVDAPGRVRESDPSDEEYDEYLREMMLGVEDLCQECREKVRGGAGIEDLDDRCSKLARDGIMDSVKK